MSTLNLLLQDGRIYCRECLVQIPATFLFCPICYGLVQEKGQWVAPKNSPLQRESEEQQTFLFPHMQEYPA